MENNWVVVFTDTFLPRVELVKALLLENSIPTIVFNQQDSVHKTVGDIQLLVDKDHLIRALHLINS